MIAAGPARRTRVKICGLTSAEDARAAVEAGADAVGVILAPSERRVTLERAVEIAAAVPGFVSLVAVVVDPTSVELVALRAALPRATVQFSGRESETLCREAMPYVKVLHRLPEGEPSESIVPSDAYADGLLMFDSRSERGGGSGRTFPWTPLVPFALARPIVVSGGLTPENVGACVRMVRPFAVDVRSGVETDGRKDVQKMNAFVEAVRLADATTR